jgi:hypothetical protein
MRLLCVLLLLFATITVKGQEPPPHPISVFVNPAQGLIFGAFFQGASGGTVTVNADGSRTSTGSIVLANLGFPFSPAIFTVQANLGARITILNGPDVTLTGSNGGFLTLHLGASLPTSPFISTATPPSRNTVRIGGTLTVGSPLANPAGNYSGIFTVTFIQE